MNRDIKLGKVKVTGGSFESQVDIIFKGGTT